MTAINVERIKLFSTRSPYWCLLGIVAAAVMFALMAGLIDHGSQAQVAFALSGVSIGQSVFMVLAALAVTTEYRFGTIRSTFLATPHRTSVLLAKTVLLALMGAVVGFVCAVGAFELTALLAARPPLPLTLSGELWRVVAGHAALYAVAAVIAVAVGSLLRHSAGAIAVLLLWPLLLEGLIGIIPKVGDKIGPWLPFRAAGAFVADTRAGIPQQLAVSTNGPSPIGGLLVFLGYAAVLWLIAAILLRRRDA